MSEQVREMFASIARRYDAANEVLSLGVHRGWRRAAVRLSGVVHGDRVLDCATGTGDLALAVRHAAPRRTVVGADFAEAMLRAAQPKLAARGERRVPLLAADALALPFRDRVFAAVTSAFVVRNLVDLARGLAEMRRVTMPGGLVVTLDITRPRVPGWDRVFGIYFHRIVPIIGTLVVGDRAAYTYLPESVERFASPPGLADAMRRAGLRDVRYRRFGFGTIALHVGVVAYRPGDVDSFAAPSAD